MALLMQEDIRSYYEKTWKQCDDAAAAKGRTRRPW